MDHITYYKPSIYKEKKPEIYWYVHLVNPRKNRNEEELSLEKAEIIGD